MVFVLCPCPLPHMSYVSVKLSQVTVTKNLCKLNDEWLWWQYWWFRSLLLFLFNVLCGVVSFIIFASVFWGMKLEKVEQTIKNYGIAC